MPAKYLILFDGEGMKAKRLHNIYMCACVYARVCALARAHISYKEAFCLHLFTCVAFQWLKRPFVLHLAFTLPSPHAQVAA
jgi:hypothetical protein